MQPVKRNNSPSRFLKYLLIAVLALVWGCAEQKAVSGLHIFNGNTMGTTFSIKFVIDNSHPLEINDDSIETQINLLLKTVNRQMSTYIPDSEISRFNQLRSTEWFSISEDFAAVLKKSLLISKQTGGALDVTVGPLVNLWGFGPENKPATVPPEKELRKLLESIGHQKIRVRLTPPAVKKERVEMYCDLSSIAKGFGVDKIAGYLESLHIFNYLVEIGGELKAQGKNDQGQIWRIGIATPNNQFGIQKVVQVDNRALATSGDYMNYFEKDGVRYSHTINPKTGRPITHKLASVTVVHDSCMTADGLATAINVLGPDKGFKFALEKKLPVFMLVRDNGKFIKKMTPEFKEILSEGNSF